jgi:D-alanine-D-alanine ligase
VAVGLRPNIAAVKPAFQYDLADMLEYLEILKMRLRIAVIYGGDKNRENAVIYRTHNPRPWKSYEAVAHDIHDALHQLGFEYVTLLSDDMTLPQRLKDEQIHLAWLNTGGVQGYDPVSHTAAMLEMLGLPYVGHYPLNASTLDNKHTFKRELQALGIPTAPFITWHPARGMLATGPGSRFRQVFADYPGPFVVKPISGRASLNILVVERIDDLPDAAYELAYQTHNMVLIETFLPGREYCVAVCGGVVYANGNITQHNQPFAFSAVERLLEPNEVIFASMDYLAITDSRLRLMREGEPERAALLDLARTIYHEFNLGSLVRVDVRADEQGTLHVLEANPKPDLKRDTGTVTSLISAGLGESGLDYTDLVMSLLVDRLHYLFTYTPGAVLHLVDLVSL